MRAIEPTPSCCHCGCGAAANGEERHGNIVAVTCPPVSVASRISVLRADWRNYEAESVHAGADHRDPEGERGGRQSWGFGAAARSHRAHDLPLEGEVRWDERERCAEAEAA